MARVVGRHDMCLAECLSGKSLPPITPESKLNLYSSQVHYAAPQNILPVGISSSRAAIIARLVEPIARFLRVVLEALDGAAVDDYQG